MSDYVRQSKNDYAYLLTANGRPDLAQELMEQDLFTPIFKTREVHPQLEPDPKQYNEMITETYHDIFTLYVGLRDAATDFHELMKNTSIRLDNIKRDLLIEKEKLEDVNVLCNQYTDFNTVVNLTKDNLLGNFSSQDDIICAKVKSQEAVSYTVSSIEGNGYEGNNYVYKDKKFLKNTIDTSNRKFISDNNEFTTYEYSRITANNSEKDIFQLVNLDSIEAKVTIAIISKSSFNKLIIKSGAKDTFITDVSISQDGVNFSPVLSQPIGVNNDALKYKEVNYIANSGLLCFPATKYLKVTLESNGVTDDTIAFEKTEVIQSGKVTTDTSNSSYAYSKAMHQMVRRI